MKSHKIFLALIIMITTMCVCVANIVKDNKVDNNDEQNFEEILPSIDIPDSKQTPLAGKVMPVKEDKKMLPYENIPPLAGEVVPINEDEISPDEYNQPPLAGCEVLSNEVSSETVNEPSAICGDIPPSFVSHPKKKTGFWRSLLNRFRRDKY